MKKTCLKTFVHEMEKGVLVQFAATGAMCPIFIGDTEEGHRVIIPLDQNFGPSGPEPMLRHTAKAYKLVRCCLIMETFYVDRHLQIGPVPKEQKSSWKEAVIFIAEDYDSGMIFAQCNVSRDENAGVALQPLEIVPFLKASGAFIGMLPPRER